MKIPPTIFNMTMMNFNCSEYPIASYHNLAAMLTQTSRYMRYILM